MQEVTQVGEPTRLHGQLTDYRNELYNPFCGSKIQNCGRSCKSVQTKLSL